MRSRRFSRSRHAARAAAAASALCAAATALQAQQPPTAQPVTAQPVAAGRSASLQGVVFDSLTRRPLAGATVQLVRADDPVAARAATSDPNGRFRLDSVAPGRYLAGFLHPQLDLLQIEVAPRAVDVGTAAARVDLAVPPLPRVAEALCGRAVAPADSSGMLAGRVRDARTEAPVPNATVVLTWSELTVGAGGVRTERRRVPVTTGPEGTFVVCGAPAGDVVTASAAAPGRASGDVPLDVPARGLLLRDFLVGDTATVPAPATDPGAAVAADAPRVARGPGRLAGVVRDTAGRPLAGARVIVWGTAAGAVSADDGAFVLDGLPVGTRTLEARAIGFAPRRVAVDVSAARTATVTVGMAAAVPTLGRVVVMGKAPRRASDLDGFARRRQTNAFGRFLTAADFERSATFLVTDALRMTPGLRVVPTASFGNMVLGRGGCEPSLVLDGMPVFNGTADLDLLVRPTDVAGVEVYSQPGTAPPQYGGVRSACGVVLVWTKR
jgi:protocatechuate 3,4-dioxygenase beta subunit